MENKVDIDKRGHALDILEQLDNFRKNNKHCDFIIKAGKEERPVHRYVVSACSEYFDAMLTHDTKENRDGVVEIKDVDSECVMKCVDFMYTGEATVSDEKQGDLMHVAHMLRLHRLYNGVALFLEKKLDFQSFFTTRQIANTYECKKLTEVCNQFAMKNFRQLAKLEGFKELEDDYLGFLLASKDMKQSEGIKCKALMVWINHDSSRASSLFDMMKHIDFMKVSMSYRKFLIDNEPSVSSSNKCLKFVVKSLFDRETETAKDISLDEEPGIVVFDCSNNRLKRLVVESKACNEMQMTQSLGNHTYSAVVLDDYIYAFVKNYSTYRLNFADDDATWEQMASNHGSYGHAIILDGLIYMTDHCRYSNRLERYDPIGNQWSITQNKTVSSCGSTLAVAQGKLFVIGGITSDSYVTSVERFDPVTSSWSNAASLRQARSVASAATLDNSIYVFGGASRNGSVQSIEVLHQNTNSWELVNMPNLNRKRFNTIPIDVMLYLVGGNTSGSQTVDRFDPHTKKITTIFNLNFNLTGLTSVATSS